MSLTVIFNPVAGGKKTRKLNRVFAELRGRGQEITVIHTKAPGDAEKIAFEHAQGTQDLLVVAGGDGTILETVNGLMLAGGGRFAIVPLGTANLLAKEIGLGDSAREIADYILMGQPKPIALAQTGERYILLMASLGLDAHVVAKVNLNLKRVVGKWAYIWEFLRQTLFVRLPQYTATINGRDYKGAGIIVSNGRYYAGSYILAPDADICKPIFHVSILESYGPWAALRYALALATNRIWQAKDIQRLEAKEVVLSSQSSVQEPIQADGDLFGFAPVTLRAMQSPIELVFPQEQ